MTRRNLVCASCGQVLAVPGQCRNPWCSADNRPLRAVYWAARYEGALRRAVIAYKYGYDMRWARTFASLLLGFLREHATWFEELSVVCPVPAFAGSAARRRFGHMELVAAELASQSGGEWPVERLVAKVAETPPMCAKPQLERRRLAQMVVRSAYRAVPELCTGRRVLLVDDVCVSGQTMLAVADALATAGASEVVGLVVARARWRGPRTAGQ